MSLITTGQQIDPNGVHHPAHYNAHPSGIEVIVVCREMTFNLGNAFKYLMRAGMKDVPSKELRKALWYVQDEWDHYEFMVQAFDVDPSEHAGEAMAKVINAEPDPDKRQLYLLMSKYWTTQGKGALKNLLDELALYVESRSKS